MLFTSTECIAFITGLSYLFVEVNDSNYGNLVNEETGAWDGMVGEILNNVRYNLLCVCVRVCVHQLINNNIFHM